MEQPRKFIHLEERFIRKSSNYPYDDITKGYLHIGRLEVSFEAIGAMALLIGALLVVAQALLAIFGGSWVIAQFAGLALAAVLALFLLSLIFMGLRGLVRYFAREITFNGPGKD